MKQKNKKGKNRTNGSLVRKKQLLSFQIETLQRKLLLSPGQILFNIWDNVRFVYDDIDRLFNSKKKKQDEITELTGYKKHLIRLSRSPFMWLVYGVRALGYLISFIPRRRELQKVKEELTVRVKRRVRYMDIVILGNSNCTEALNRSRLTARFLAQKGHRVFYVENRFTVSAKQSRFNIEKWSDNLYRVRLGAVRDIQITYHKPSQAEIKSINRSLKDVIQEIKPSKNTIFKIDHPFWGHLTDIWERPMIYDMITDYGLTGYGLPKHLLSVEQRLVKQAKRILVPIKTAAKRLKKTYPKKTIIIPNAAEYSHYFPASIRADTCTVGLCWIKKPVIGMLGGDQYIDTALLRDIATVFPKASVVIEGKITTKHVAELAKQYDNLFLIGEKPREMLPKHLQTFDICMAPYVKDALICDPHELYDYLSAGKAVVTTIPFVQKKLNKLIYHAAGGSDFILQLHRALREPAVKMGRLRQKAVKKETWENRIQLLEKEMRKIIR